MIPSSEVEILEYLAPNGRSPYAEWFGGLNAQAAAKVSVALTRVGPRQFRQRQGRGLWGLRVQAGLRPRLPSLFWERREPADYLVGRREQKAAAEGHKRGDRQVAGLQKKEAGVIKWL